MHLLSPADQSPHCHFHHANKVLGQAFLDSPLEWVIARARAGLTNLPVIPDMGSGFDRD